MSADQPGLVVVSHGRHAIVEAADGSRVLCQVSSKRLQIVCGDQVKWHPDETPDRGTILERLPRRSELTRTDAAGRAETVVANPTQLIVIIAPQPQPDFFIVDRYLAAAELIGLRAALVLNKVDFADATALSACRAELVSFISAGYAVLECSAETGAGIDTLRSQMTNQVTVLVGQSGVGKSSLANRLLPNLRAATADLSRSTEEGRHTTSVAALHYLNPEQPSSGALIDSPGVRDFAPAIELLGAPANGFREIAHRAPQCRFKDCRHLREPGCAVRAAIEAGEISERRYESYYRLLRLSEDLAPRPGSRKGR